MALGYKVLPDGTIVFPNRGTPPIVAPEGYEQDPGDPYIFRPIWPECVLREQREITLPKCKAKMIKPYCKKMDITVSIKYCQGCKVPDDEKSGRISLPNII